MNFFRGSAPPTLAWLDWSHCRKKKDFIDPCMVTIELVLGKFQRNHSGSWFWGEQVWHQAPQPPIWGAPGETRGGNPFLSPCPCFPICRHLLPVLLRPSKDTGRQDLHLHVHAPYSVSRISHFNWTLQKSLSPPGQPWWRLTGCPSATSPSSTSS